MTKFWKCNNQKENKSLKFDWYSEYQESEKTFDLMDLCI